MQLSADRPDALDQRALDRGVHILGVRRPGERPRRDLGGDALELLHQRGRVLCRDHALTTEHLRVRDAPAHVVRREALVELERRGEVAHPRVEGALEASLPEILHLVRFFVFGASSAFLGTSSIASLPSPQSACVRACVRSGRPKTVMKPSEDLWSNWSPFPYVASAVE